MEHVRQSSEEHAPGSFDVAEDMTQFGLAADLTAVPVFPFVDVPEKLVSINCTMNAGDTEKGFSELSGVGGPRIAAAPRQPLPLNVYQASLDRYTGPESPEDPDHLGIAINGKATREQSVSNESPEECQELRLRVLGDTILTGQEHVSLGVHHGNEAEGAVKKSPIEDEVMGFSKSPHALRRSLYQIVIDHAIKLRRAMSALVRQLPDRVTFDNPTPEPFLFIRISGLSIMPTERMSANVAEPPLSAIGITAISLEGRA